MNCVKNEKNILQANKHVFLIGLKYFLQSETQLFFITKFCYGGDLLFHINTQKSARFGEGVARFYAA